ncbi:SMP-30/gluconolactonase/LRE family protein [Bradyrhizobium sp. HKCCYLS3077]|uniref:SMP-30/gluconolactonase/LRE family protein n=1 Tax=Bradyrhizobium sp. HKCCYLS3077 TaxID=3420761 RepID=UPI003EB7AE8A
MARTATNPTCVCFGGPDLKTLFVTTAKGRTKTKLPQPVGYGSSVLLRGGATTDSDIRLLSSSEVPTAPSSRVHR